MKIASAVRLALASALWVTGYSLSAFGAQADGSSDVEIDGPPPPAAPEVLSRDSQGRVTVRASRIAEPLVLDGRLDENAYSAVRSMSGFVQQDPDEGAPATEETEVWIFFDEHNVYVSARCWDSHPERMVANELRRDSNNLVQNENFALTFDTFYDRRNAFFFHTNPLGGMTDALSTDERNVNKDWNTVWDVKTARFEEGWTVEIAIPFKSLRYRAGRSQVWGVNFRRIVRWKNEVSYLSPIPAAYGLFGITQVSSNGTLVGIEAPAGSKNIEVKPYVISALTTDREAEPPVDNHLGADAGFDVKYGITQSLIADFTYNTDFAQVEQDAQQVNLTRFSLFFPEKRDFFLEGQGIFGFGGGSQLSGGGGGGFFGARPPSNTPILFFSRRIGLAEGLSVPIRAGGRLTGKAGPFTIGALNIQTESSARAGAEATNFSVVRLKRDVLRRSSVGVIATHRSPTLSGEGTNTAYGVDGAFSFYENLRLNGYYARTETEGLSREDVSYQAALDYNADRYGIEAEHLLVGENFKPEIGFLRRSDFRRSYGKFRFSPRPQSIASIRKIGLEPSLDYITDVAGRLETRQAQLTFFMELENGDRWNVDLERNFEDLDEPFDITEDVVIPVGSYHFTNFRANYSLGPQRRVAGTVTFQTGGFFDGDRQEIRYNGRVEVTPKLSVEPNVSVNWIDLPGGAFTTTLVSSRVNVMLSARMLAAALLQYNTDNDSISTNLRFHWEYQPGSDLFVVYSDGRSTLRDGFPFLVNRTFAIKFTRLFRF